MPDNETSHPEDRSAIDDHYNPEESEDGIYGHQVGGLRQACNGRSVEA